MAKIADELVSLFKSSVQQAGATKQEIEQTVEEAKQAAVTYAAIQLTLQAISTAAVVVVAYCAFSTMCGKKDKGGV